MVLSRIVLCIILATACGCLTQRIPTRSAQELTLGVALVIEHPEQAALDRPPQEVLDRVAAIAQRRNVQMIDLLDASALQKRFEQQRESSARMALLRNAESAAEIVLLVEAKPRFHSKIGGSYRWSIPARISISSRSQDTETLTHDFEVPAFLRLSNQGAGDALVAAKLPFTQQVESTLDRFLLASQGTATRSSPSPNIAQSPPPNPNQTGTAGLGDNESIYFVMIDRFHNGDPSNDSQSDPSDSNAFHGGDLRGLVDKLPYIKDMGFSTLWLSPIFKMRDRPFEGHGAFHGYWLEDFSRLEPRFGDEQLARNLRKSMQSDGIKLLLDIVLNHVSFDAPLVDKHPDWFHTEPSIVNWSDTQELIRHKVHGLPDLDQDHPAVYDHLVSHSKKWVDILHPAGFRLDAVKHISPAFWTRYNQEMRRSYGKDFILLGEVYDGNPVKIAELSEAGSFQAVFDFPLYFAMIDVFCNDAHPGAIATILSADRLYPRPITARKQNLITFLDNHDLPRLVSACHGDFDRVENALSFLFSSRGTPAITWGTEEALEGAEEPNNRASMTFPQKPKLRSHIRDLLDKRDQHAALRQAADAFLRLDRTTLIIERTTADENCLVGINTASEPYEFEGRTRADGTLWTLPARRVTTLCRSVKSKRERERHKTTGRYTLHLPDKLAAESLGPLYVTGSGPELGDWEPTKAHGPFERRDGTVTLELELPHGKVFAYKIVQRQINGEFMWEERENRYLFTEAPELTVSGGPVFFASRPQNGKSH